MHRGMCVCSALLQARVPLGADAMESALTSQEQQLLARWPAKRDRLNHALVHLDTMLALFSER